tara:strand:+ start:69 stop:749 length:681 start_codon:yes stop_codon:yes gene_type:complete
MSHFISMYDVVFGTRSTKESDVETDDGKFKSRYGSKDKAVPVDLTKVVCAIEDKSVNSYYFDDFGRFGLIKHDDEGGAKARVKVLLSGYARASLLEEPRELDEYERSLADFDESPEWHTFGWMADEFPDFDACYENWKVENGMKGKTAPPMKTPAAQSHFWKLTGKLLKTVIGEDAYNTVLKGDYTKAVSALQNHKNKEFRYSDNEKKALRENLKKIVTNAPLSEM